MKITNYFRKYADLTLIEKKLFFEALLFLFVAKGMFLIFPFSVCLKTIKKVQTVKFANTDELHNIKIAVGRANKLAFWRNICLVQSFAARWMLQKRGIASLLYIGVKKNDTKKIAAHAWLVVNDMEITHKGEDYIVLAVY